MRNKFKHFLSHRMLGFWGFCAGSIAIFALFFFYRPDPLMIITAESRGLHYVVANVEKSHVLFRKPAAVITEMGATKLCSAGLLEPKIASDVSYSIFDNFLLIVVAAESDVAARFHRSNLNNETLEIKTSGSISYGPGTGCLEEEIEEIYPPVRLPIWGSTVLGRTPLPSTMVGRTDPFSGLLISGRVSVFGKTLRGNGLYPAGEFEIPAGSRLSSPAADDKANIAPWWGFAAYTPHPNETELRTLAVSASTTTKSLNINRQAGPVAEKIEAGYFTRLSGEPFFAFIAAILAATFFFSQFLLALRDLRKG